MKPGAEIPAAMCYGPGRKPKAVKTLRAFNCQRYLKCLDEAARADAVNMQCVSCSMKKDMGGELRADDPELMFEYEAALRLFSALFGVGVYESV